jgi:hypothetical protein
VALVWMNCMNFSSSECKHGSSCFLPRGKRTTKKSVTTLGSLWDYNWNQNVTLQLNAKENSNMSNSSLNTNKGIFTKKNLTFEEVWKINKGLNDFTKMWNFLDEKLYLHEKEFESVGTNSNLDTNSELKNLLLTWDYWVVLSSKCWALYRAN